MEWWGGFHTNDHIHIHTYVDKKVWYSLAKYEALGPMLACLDGASIMDA